MLVWEYLVCIRQPSLAKNLQTNPCPSQKKQNYNGRNTQDEITYTQVSSDTFSRRSIDHRVRCHVDATWIWSFLLLKILHVRGAHFRKVYQNFAIFFKICKNLLKYEFLTNLKPVNFLECKKWSWKYINSLKLHDFLVDFYQFEAYLMHIDYSISNGMFCIILQVTVFTFL